MKYKNIKTGVVIETTSKIIGKAWNPVDKLEESQSEAGEETEEVVEEEINLEELTKAELIALAKEHEIEVNESDKKAVIIDTIVNAFE